MEISPESTKSESLLKDDATSSEVVVDRMTEYAEFTTRTKLPHNIDGLKPVQRRILLTIGTSDEEIKTLPLAGQVMSLHPHGDASISSAIIRLTQPFSDIVPLLGSDSNVGTYSGKEAAAGRYLPVFGSSFMKDVFFNRTNLDTLTAIPAESGHGIEYDYLIPIIPYALCTSAMGIAIGYKCDVAPLSLGSVCDLVVDYIKLKKMVPPVTHNEMYQKLAKYFLPDFTSQTLVRNAHACYANYEKGVYKVPLVHDGTIELHPNMIVITSIPYGKVFATMHDRIGQSCASKKGFIAENIDRIDDLSTEPNFGQVECILRRGVSPFDILDQFKSLIGFEGSFTPIPNWYTTTGRMNELSPFELLEAWYIERSRSILANLKHTQTRLVNENRKLNALIIILDHTQVVVDIFHQAKTKEDTVAPLVSRFGLTTYQAQYLAGLNLGQITNRGKADLQKALDDNIQKITELQQQFVTIPETIMADALYVKKTYASIYPRRAKLPDFIGNVTIDGKGMIQFSSLKELHHIEKRFHNSTIEVEIYPKGSHHTYFITDMGVTSEEELDAPKECTGRSIVVSKYKLKYTVVLNDGCIYRLQGFIPASKIGEKATVAYVGDSLVAVTKNGRLTVKPATELTLRKAYPAQGVQTDVMYISANVDDEMVVIHANSAIPGELRIERVSDGDMIMKTPIGKTEILGIFRYSDPWVINVPDKYRPRGGMRHIAITNNAEFFKGDRMIKIQLSKKATRKEHLVPLGPESEVMIDVNPKQLHAV